MDLSKPSSAQFIESKIDEGNVFFIPMVPPCGAASRARDKPIPAWLRRQGVPSPPPLRSSEHPSGLPAHKGQLKGEAKAIRVPRGRNDKIPPQAFSFHTEVRHVLVESGMRIVGEAAWRSCQQLQVVHLPDTVVSLLHGAFSRCRVLRVVIAPGCQHVGAKVFEECCSLTQIGVTQCPGNILAPQAQLRPRVFQGCTALQRLDLGKEGRGPTYLNQSLPDCCFLEAGIVALYLPSDFNRIGTAACVSCQQLQTVDLSQTRASELLGSTFARCSQLQQLSLPQNLRIIEQEAFLKCTSLQEVCIPSSLLYIARRAFAGCTQLRTVRKKGKAQHGEVPTPGAMLLTNASNWTSPIGSDSCRQIPTTNGGKTSTKPYSRLATL